ncbi:MAG TPA: hypothetical protein VK864_01455, partial [Longimicrobiales bacterium]|nr:hypothetical protein [Longimicrobiales bacterium]
GTALGEREEDVRKLLEGERSAEFESFHAYESGIDVTEQGIVAMITKYLERDALVLWDLRKRDLVGRYQWPDLVGLRSPGWDPTGRRVVFEGLSAAGFSDLYVIDFDTQKRSALTNDKYADRDPDWSPDGRTIVFSSDRTPYGSDGYTNLYAFDVSTNATRPLTLGRWHDQQPRWSHRGDRIAFSSDRNGSYDLFAIDSAGAGRRLTTLTGGAFDPEWLPDDRGMVFVGFAEGTFRIYEEQFGVDTIRTPVVALTADAVSEPGWDWAVAAGAEQLAQRVDAYRMLDRVSLDFAGGDAIFAPGLGSAQGAQFLLSDMLGNHILFAGISAVQADEVSDLIDNFSGNLLYLNLSRRLNYGAGLFRFTGRFRDVAFDLYDESTLGAYFVASYPFSKFNRVEAQLAFERSQRTDVEDIRDDLGDGAADGDLTREGTLASNYLSYVHDNTLWVPTGPIDGVRYNLTAGLVSCFACEYPSSVTGAPVSRSAAVDNYVLIGDYRRYFRTSQYSAYAIRGYVFLSSGAVPARAVLGGPHRLRGYPRFSLAGSRVWLLNQEWRFPILNTWSLGFPFGELRLPGVQGALFADAGSSWLDTQDRPRGTWGSYGISFRTSLGAPLVLRLDVGRRYRVGARPPVNFSGDERFGDTFVDFFFGFNY